MLGAQLVAFGPVLGAERVEFGAVLAAEIGEFGPQLLHDGLGFGGGVFGCLLPGLGAGLCGPGRLRVGVRGRHRGGGLPAQVFGLLLDALSFLGQRAALLVEHGLDAFGGISFGGGDALFGVESDVLGFFPGDRVGRDGELGKAYGDEPPRSSRPNPR